MIAVSERDEMVVARLGGAFAGQITEEFEAYTSSVAESLMSISPV